MSLRNKNLAAAMLLVAAACSRRATAPSDVLCTVNGVAIREADVEYRLRTNNHGGALTPEARQNLLESIVREQLVYDRAVELGLDADPSYREAVTQLEAHSAAVKRRRMAEIFSRREITGRVEVSDQDARRYFDANKDRLGTEVHVLQIQRRSLDDIRRDEDALARGAPFDELARGSTPSWDLGYVKWVEVPESWRASLEGLKSGQVSKILHAGKDRYWIIKLVESRQGAEVPFESVKAGLVERLRGSQAERRRDEIDAELRRHATIVYSH